MPGKIAKRATIKTVFMLLFSSGPIPGRSLMFRCAAFCSGHILPELCDVLKTAIMPVNHDSVISRVRCKEASVSLINLL
jgi:hypothetical protein